MSDSASDYEGEIVELRHRFSFEAAHHLPAVPEDHKCRRLHGHSFQAEIVVSGPVGAQSGWVLDYSELKGAVRPLLERLDHHHLNDIEGLENPTSEHIAIWIWNRLSPDLPGLTAVSVDETCNNGCTYRGVATNRS